MNAHDLIQAHLDGSISGAETVELESALRGDPAARAVFAAALRQDVLLGEVMAEAPAARGSGRLWGLAAAAALLIGLAALLLAPGAPARLDASRGEVRFDGSRLETLAGASAVLRLPDGARLHAGAETRLRVVADEVTLETGTLAVDVSPRARVFQTPHAQIRAHGSRFTLSVDATSTLCKVEDGRLALFDVLGASPVEVAAGHYAIATSQAELKAEPLAVLTAAGPSIRLIAPARWPRKYGVWTFRPGALIYGDRGYRITDMPPELEGALGIATMAEDRRSADAELLVFELDREASVWVGIDGRAAQDLGKLPAWLAGWERTGLKIHSLTAGNSYYHLFRKRFPAGRVALGGNHQGGDTGAKVNYTVLVTAP